jgi:uncharacterized protein YbjT (DUF2867 family)
MNKKVIITGATGMVGRGVLYESLESSLVAEVLLINRSAIEIKHPKIKEILLKDFTQISSVKDQLVGYDACYFCMGVSSIGLSEEEFHQLTFEPVKAFADVLQPLNPNMIFTYVSGTGTDSSEKGKVMWARVKGKTENHILNKRFGDAYAYRAGLILPEKGIKSKTGWYNAIYVIFKPFFPLFKKSKNVTSTTNIGQAMLSHFYESVPLKHLENKDINLLASRNK